MDYSQAFSALPYFLLGLHWFYHQTIKPKLNDIPLEYTAIAAPWKSQCVEITICFFNLPRLYQLFFLAGTGSTPSQTSENMKSKTSRVLESKRCPNKFENIIYIYIYTHRIYIYMNMSPEFLIAWRQFGDAVPVR